VIGGGFLRHGAMAGAAEMIAGLIAGEVTIAFAHGEASSRTNPADVATAARREGDVYRIEGAKAVVLNAAQASHLVVVARTAGDTRDRHGLSAFLVDADSAGITRRDYRTLSGGRASDLTLTDVPVPAERLLAPEGEALPLIEQVLDEAAALVCAEAIGVMDRLLGDTLDYTKQRQQFGRALASFQILQHRMVDMLSMKTQAAAIAARAVGLLEAPPEERAQAVSAAKVYVGKAARFLGQQAIQLHGGMGMTDELAVGFFFKRAIEIERQFGSIDHHLTRYERLAFRPVAA
jgi:alkylation response protein AidB-like acyl-CoA dehydrogenase